MTVQYKSLGNSVMFSHLETRVNICNRVAKFSVTGGGKKPYNSNVNYSKANKVCQFCATCTQ